MLDDRERHIANAAALLSAEDFTADGMPRLDAINPLLEKAGVEPLTKIERDETWETIAAKAAEELAQAEVEAQAAVEADVSDEPWAFVRINSAPMNPVPVYVNGVCVASLRVAGDAVLLPPAAIASLRNSDVTFTETAQ